MGPVAGLWWIQVSASGTLECLSKLKLICFWTQFSLETSLLTLSSCKLNRPSKLASPLAALPTCRICKTTITTTSTTPTYPSMQEGLRQSAQMSPQAIRARITRRRRSRVLRYRCHLRGWWRPVRWKLAGGPARRSARGGSGRLISSRNRLNPNPLILKG